MTAGSSPSVGRARRCSLNLAANLRLRVRPSFQSRASVPARRLVVRRLQRRVVDDDTAYFLREMSRSFLRSRGRCPKLHRSNFLQPCLRVGLVDDALALPPLHDREARSPRSSEAFRGRVGLRGRIRASSRIRCPRLPRDDLLAVAVVDGRLGQVIAVSAKAATVSGSRHPHFQRRRRTTVFCQVLARNVLAVVVPGRLRAAAQRRGVERPPCCKSSVSTTRGAAADELDHFRMLGSPSWSRARRLEGQTVLQAGFECSTAVLVTVGGPAVAACSVAVRTSPFASTGHARLSWAAKSNAPTSGL